MSNTTHINGTPGPSISNPAVSFRDLTPEDLASLVDLLRTSGVDRMNIDVTALPVTPSPEIPLHSVLYEVETLPLHNHGINEWVTNSIARLAIRQSLGNDPESTDESISLDEVRAFLTTHPDLVDSADYAQSHRVFGCNPTSVGYSHWLISRINGTSAADAFFRPISTLVDLKSNSASLLLVRRFLAEGREGNLTNDRAAALIVHAFNHEARGSVLERLRPLSNWSVPVPDRLSA